MINISTNSKCERGRLDFPKFIKSFCRECDEKFCFSRLNIVTVLQKNLRAYRMLQRNPAVMLCAYVIHSSFAKLYQNPRELSQGRNQLRPSVELMRSVWMFLDFQRGINTSTQQRSVSLSSIYWNAIRSTIVQSYCRAITLCVEMVISKAVSYTHLDVYKRQV